MRSNLVLITALLLGGAACRHKPSAEEELSAGSGEPTGGARGSAPIDHVAADSLVPGTAKAFALVLPMGFQQPIKLENRVSVAGTAPVPQVVGYIKERVRDGKVLEGAASETRFKGVRIPDEPDRYLDIVVEEKRGLTVITVDDVTPAPALPPATPEERYQQAGLAPNGHLLNPKRIE